MSRISVHDQRAMTIAPTIPMTGSIQTQPRYRPATKAAIASTEVRASARTWMYAERRLLSPP